MSNEHNPTEREKMIWQYYLALASRPGTIYAESFEVAVSAVDYFETQIVVMNYEAPDE